MEKYAFEYTSSCISGTTLPVLCSDPELFYSLFIFSKERGVNMASISKKELAGIDQQLNKAIEVILEELKTKEKNIPPCQLIP